jgi:lipopolysaccharide biosynthesis glycosyltransferase
MTKAPLYQNCIPIVFASNEYFVPYMAATMQSIMENANPAKKYAFFVLHRDISLQTAELLKTQISGFGNFSIDLVEVSGFFAGYEFFIANRNDISVETYFRLVIPEVFSEYEKVIYLDGDMICRADIGELFEIEMGDNLVAACRDITGIIGYYHDKIKNIRNNKAIILRAANMDNYFIAGMLVIHIAQFKNMFSTKYLLDFAVSRNWQAHDQDILNVLCEGKAMLLPLEWAFTYDDDASHYLPDYLLTEYDRAQKSPNIIHFAWRLRKPWKTPFNVPYFDFFWKYATRTPFIDIIISRMNEEHLIGLRYAPQEWIISDIKNRGYIGLRFLLKCIKIWLLRGRVR